MKKIVAFSEYMNFKLLNYYVGSVEDINEDNSQGIIDMYTDAWFAYGHHKTVEYLTRYGVIVFQYLFAYEGQHDKSYSSQYV